MTFALAERVADAVLYEGYVLYPYRASSVKNRVRFQFGVVAPLGGVEPGGSESWEMQTECLVAPAPGELPTVDVKIRFLQVQARSVEAPSSGGARCGTGGEATGWEAVTALDWQDETLSPWDEGVERQVRLRDLPLVELLARERSLVVAFPGGEEVEELRTAVGELRGRLVRRRWPIEAVVRLSAEPVRPPEPARPPDAALVRLRVRLENTAPWPAGAPPDREAALRRSLLGSHTLLAVRGGAFVSLLEPPPEAAAAAAACANLHTWPVLIGDQGGSDVMLSSPIILYDHPAVAPESPGDLCDSTEIDEILTLRIMTLTDAEKREARGTDARARRIVERSDNLPPEVLERLHGALRSITPVASATPAASAASWEDFLNPPGAVPPQEATLAVAGTVLRRGSRVLLRPSRRADSMDLFLAGRAALVAAILRDVEDNAHLAVTLEDDPAADLRDATGRYLYFYPDEVEPLPDVATAAPSAVQRS